MNGKVELAIGIAMAAVGVTCCVLGVHRVKLWEEFLKSCEL